MSPSRFPSWLSRSVSIFMTSICVNRFFFLPLHTSASETLLTTQANTRFSPQLPVFTPFPPAIVDTFTPIVDTFRHVSTTQSTIFQAFNKSVNVSTPHARALTREHIFFRPSETRTPLCQLFFISFNISPLIAPVFFC